MKLKANKPRLDVDPANVAMLAIVLCPGSETILEGDQPNSARRVNRVSGRVTSPLQRVSSGVLHEFALWRERRARPEIFAVPVYWCPRPGYIEVYPPPDRDYEVIGRTRDGRPLDGEAKAAQVMPVEALANSIAVAHREAQREMAAPVRVERFTLTGEE
jgi:hypothetical protein